MKKAEKVIAEIHLYKNKIEALIKVLIWIISWIGGILVLLGTENKEVLGSAYLVYTLSLLMEFVPGIYEKTQFLSRLIHTALCFILSLVCAFSVSILLGVSLANTYYSVMFDLIVCVIIFMVLDTFFLWVIPEKVDTSIGDGEIDKKKFDEEQKFEDSLYNGNLGRIKERVKNNE